jgi:asparagine synthetase B (glutamine-hydrolysing)
VSGLRLPLVRRQVAMCGLVGAYGGPLDRQAALAAVAHRGADGSGWKVIDQTTLGHTRLAIQDTSDAAAQPFRRRGRYGP